MKRFSVVSRGDRNFGDSKKLSMSPAHGEGENFIQSDVHRVSTKYQGYRNRYDFINFGQITFMCYENNDQTAA